MPNDIQTFYDLTAEKVADDWYSNNILLPSIQEFLSLMAKNSRVLDLGCGSGYESMRLHHEGAEVLGIDFSEESIKIARERCRGCQFEVMDFRELDQRFGLFDGVFSSASLIHIAPDEIGGVIRRISGILKNKGYLLAIIRDGEGIHESWSNLEVDGVKLQRTVYCYTREKMIALCEKNNLHYVKEGFLAEDLSAYNWRSYIFQKRVVSANL